MRNYLIASIVLVAVSAVGATRPVPNIEKRPGDSTGAISLNRVVELQLPPTAYPLAVNFGPQAQFMYLTDLANGRLARVNLNRGTMGDWVTLDSARCPLFGPRVFQVRAMRTVPLLLVAICGRIELIDADSLHRTKTILKAGNDVEEEGFDLSPDERELAVTIQRVAFSAKFGHHVHAEPPYAIIYDTATWSSRRAWHFAYSHFTPDGQQLAAYYSNTEGVANEGRCGFRLYNSTSGELVSQVVARTDEEHVGCPLSPLHFRAGEPTQVVVDDPTESAIAVWNIKTGKLIRHLSEQTTGPGPAAVTNSLSLSYDGRLAAVVRSRDEGVPDYSVTIWDLSNGKSVYHTLAEAVSDAVRGVFFSPYSNILTFVYAKRVEVYEYKGN